MVAELAHANNQSILASPDDYASKIAKLQPGDVLELKPGIYERGLRFRQLNGRADAPITVRAAVQSQRPRFVASAERNTISLRDSSYLIIRDLELDGRGLSVSGVKAEGDASYTHHITLDNLHIHSYHGSQQAVGISTKCPSWNWIIRNSIIENTGTGIYLGNSDGNAPFIAGVIENNLINASIGYNLQIKHQNPRPDIAGLPRDPRKTVIRRNVFAKDESSATKEMARPNVLIGHWPRTGPGRDDEYLIYGNFFWRNTTEALFQGEGNFSLYNNVLVNREGSAIHVQPHNDEPKTVNIFHNTVLASEKGIRVLVREGKSFDGIQVTANLVFAARPIEGGIATANVIGHFNDANRYLKYPSAPLSDLDVSPKEALGIKAEFDIPPELADKTGANLDFDGYPSDFHYIGAYSRGSSIVWLPQLERRH